MDVTTLKRDYDKVLGCFSEQADGYVIALKDFEVHIPVRFMENGFAEVTDTVTTLAVLGIVTTDGYYTSMIALMALKLCPSEMSERVISGTKYLVMSFYKDDIFVDNVEVPKDANWAYFDYKEFLLYARKPWYLNKDDVTSILDTAGRDLGKPIGNTPHVVRTMCSIMFRDPDNLDNPYRNSKAMLDGRDPEIVGLNNGSMLIDGTFGKLSGGYLSENIISAIVKPDTKVTDLERIIKGEPDE